LLEAAGFAAGFADFAEVLTEDFEGAILFLGASGAAGRFLFFCAPGTVKNEDSVGSIRLAVCHILSHYVRSTFSHYTRPRKKKKFEMDGPLNFFGSTWCGCSKSQGRTGL
jgi:hypothetical protein